MHSGSCLAAAGMAALISILNVCSRGMWAFYARVSGALFQATTESLLCKKCSDKNREYRTSSLKYAM